MLKEKIDQIKSENPFYGQKALFDLYKTERLSVQKLKDTYNECKTDIRFNQLFHMIMFDKGGINRNNNAFKKEKNIEKAGKSENENWILYLTYLLDYAVNDFIELLKYRPELKCSLFFEFVGPREFLYYQVRTMNKTQNIIGYWGLLKTIINHKNKQVLNTLLDTVEQYIRNGSEFQRWQMAKMIHPPKNSKRQKRNKEGIKIEGGRKLKVETKDKFDVYETFCDDISKRMDWQVILYPNNKRYIGFLQWRKDYIDDTEFVLFSNKKILEFDKDQFMKWLNNLPAGSRYRVKRRLYNPEKGDNWKNKYGSLKDWFDAWENYKKDMQAEERILMEKEKKQGLTDVEKERLVKVKKESKVNIGAMSISDYVNKFIENANSLERIDSLIVDALVKATENDVPVMVITDISRSMGFNEARPMHIARLITTLQMLKNPHNHSNVLFTFGSNANCYTDSSIGQQSTNRFMTSKSTKVNKIIDRTMSFIWNYQNISKFITSDGNSTNIASVGEKIKEWVNSEPEFIQMKKEQLMDYKVFLIISDGDLNNDSTQLKSVQQLQMDMKQWFGWDGVIVLWDVVPDSKNNKSSYFDTSENIIHLYGYNPGILNQVFSKITDIDIIDIYTPLKSLYESNRYSIIKNYIN